MGNLLSLVRLEHVQERTSSFFLTDVHEIHSTQHHLMTKCVVHILDCINDCI